MKEHLQWWENNLHSPEIEKTFSNWLIDSDLNSRIKLFELIKKYNINNVLEIGPGIFIDYNMFFSKEKDIKYTSLDITKKIVNNGKKMGIKCDEGSIESIIYDDLTYDLVYCRHVFEHLDYYSIALNEMLRVSKKYVIIIFWLINDGDTDNIIYDENEKLYHNKYSKLKLESFLKEKNLKFEWFYGNNDKILFIEK